MGKFDPAPQSEGRVEGDGKVKTFGIIGMR